MSTPVPHDEILRSPLVWYTPNSPAHYGYDTRIPDAEGWPIRPDTVAALVAHTEPVLLARSYNGSEYYAEPLYTKPLEIRDDNVDNNDLAVFAADYPN